MYDTFILDNVGRENETELNNYKSPTSQIIAQSISILMFLMTTILNIFCIFRSELLFSGKKYV